MNPFPYEDSDLNTAIASAFAGLTQHSPDSKEYAEIVKQLSALYKLKNDTARTAQDAAEFAQKFQLDLDKHQLDEAKLQLENDIACDARELAERPFLMRVSPDTALTVVANLIIGFAVIKYEQTGVIRTEIRNFMRKI